MRRYAQKYARYAQALFGPLEGSLAMRGSESVYCSKGASHDSLDLRSKRCRDCGCSLQKKCPDCDKVVSYSNAAKHAKHCKEGAESVCQIDCIMTISELIAVQQSLR
jgi:hypothetical protein